MKTKNTKAFPNTIINADGIIICNQEGMELRDYFAGLAMQTLIGKQVSTEKYIGKTVGEVVSELSYGYADEMMKIRDFKNEL